MLNRRDALRGLTAIGLGGVTPAFAGDNSGIALYGAVPPTRKRRDLKRFHNTFRPFRDISRELDKNVFLFHNLQKEIGEIKPHTQSNVLIDGVDVSGEGDCVGHATAMGCDVLAATNIHMLGMREKWEAKTSVEMMYAGSRIEIGRDNDPDNPTQVNHLARRGGSRGTWAARFVNEYGVLHRKLYQSGNFQKLDLRGYNPARSRAYRDAGVPDWLEPIARDHPVREISNVQTGQEALDAVCAGQPVILCSSWAFYDTRNKDGFAEPYTGGGYQRGRRWYNVRRYQWWHAMILTGAILVGGRVGGVIQNSHGEWNSGPLPYDMPAGSFAVELSVLNTMVQDWFDCYALSSYKGHAARRMRIKLY